MLTETIKWLTTVIIVVSSLTLSWQVGRLYERRKLQHRVEQVESRNDCLNRVK